MRGTSIVVAFGLGCSAPAKPDVATPPPPATAQKTGPKSWFAPKEVTSIAQLIPFQRWPGVPARAIGIVFVTGRQPWGGSIDHLRNVIDRSSYPQTYAFSAGRSSPHSVMWEATSGGALFMKDYSVCKPSGGELRLDATAYSEKSRNAYGLSRRAHIVELEVNHGQGGCGGTFVATASKILDGTPDIPMDPEAVILELRKRFDNVVATYSDKLVVDTSGDTNLKNVKRTQTVGILPTWIATTRQLEVLFVYRDLAEGDTQASRGRVDPFLLARPAPPQTRQVGHGVAMAARYTTDRTGRFLSEQIYLPSAFTEHDHGPRDWFNYANETP